MKIVRFVILILTILAVSCGKSDLKGERCRSADEAQMKCQVDYAEKYEVFVIPDHIKKLCLDYYPQPGCYNDSSKRHYW